MYQCIPGDSLRGVPCRYRQAHPDPVGAVRLVRRQAGEMYGGASAVGLVCASYSGNARVEGGLACERELESKD